MPKDNYKTVKGKWDVILEPEFYLSVICPNKKCNHSISDYEMLVPNKHRTLSFYKSEGVKINQFVLCPYCKTKFKLQVPEKGC